MVTCRAHVNDGRVAVRGDGMFVFLTMPSSWIRRDDRVSQVTLSDEEAHTLFELLGERLGRTFGAQGSGTGGEETR